MDDHTIHGEKKYYTAEITRYEKYSKECADTEYYVDGEHCVDGEDAKFQLISNCISIDLVKIFTNNKNIDNLILCEHKED
jgi:hypothetical protein